MQMEAHSGQSIRIGLLSSESAESTDGFSTNENIRLEGLVQTVVIIVLS